MPMATATIRRQWRRDNLRYANRIDVEQKNAADGVQDLSNPHDVDNRYTWSSFEDGDSTDRDGTLYTDFIAKLNGAVAHFVESEQLGGSRDWRAPTLAELQTLLAEPCPGSGSGSGPCVVDPVFLPAAKFLYWTSTALPEDFIGVSYAWGVFFNVGGAIDVDKGFGLRARRRTAAAKSSHAWPMSDTSVAWRTADKARHGLQNPRNGGASKSGMAAESRPTSIPVTTPKKNKPRPARALRSAPTRKPPAFVVPMAAQVVKRLQRATTGSTASSSMATGRCSSRISSKSSFDPVKTRTSPGCIGESRRQDRG